MPRTIVAQTVRSVVAILLLSLLVLGVIPSRPTIASSTGWMDDPAQRSTPLGQTDNKSGEQEGDSAEDEGAISELADARRAVIQIEAVGTFVDPEEGLQANAAGRGSGFIIDEAGIAVTNNHVVTGGALFRVYVDGQEEPLNARVLGVSECADLAVIDIQGDGYPYLDWYDDPIKVGLEVYAVGFPLGDPEFTMTRGIIAKEQASGDTAWASIDHVLQHDADIAPGNSGGPLIDENAQVVGINYRLNDSGQYFAISRDEALSLIETLRSGEDVDSLGINSEAVVVGDDLYGIWVSSVESGSPAEDVGLEGGDIILSVEGLEMATDGTMATYCEILRSHTPSDIMSLEVLRFETEEVLEGQLNGRPLETSFSLADTVDEETLTQGGTPLPEGQPYEEYVAVTDEQGIITIEVPTEWTDVSEVAWAGSDDVQFGIQLWSAPDVEEFSNSWGMPGVVVSYSDELNGEFTTEDLVDSIDYSDTCTFIERGELPDGFFSGFYDVWEACDEAGSTVLILGLAPETDDYMLRIATYSVTQADLDASDHILDTFLISPVSGRPEESESSELIAGTVDDIDLSGLIYDYLYLEDPTLSALIPAPWEDIIRDDWIIDDEPIGLVLSASPDVTTFEETWTMPGFAAFMRQADGDPDFEYSPTDVLDNSDFSDTCEYDDRLDHQHTIYGITYTGALDIWRNCDGEENTFVVLSAASDPVDHGVSIYYLAVEDGDFEAFDVLEQSFYVNTEGVAALIEDAESLVDSKGGLGPDDLVTFVDEDGAFALEIPAAWDDLVNDAWIEDEEEIGRSMTAATDLVGFEETWNTPGVFVGTSASLAELFTPEELVDVFRYDDCTFDDGYEYSDDYLMGGYEVWTECADIEGQVFVVFAANPIDDEGEVDDSQIVLLYANLLTDFDADAFFAMLNSLVVGSGTTASATSNVEELPTATIVVNALNVRNGPGTNYARVATVYLDDRVTVAAQSGDCAWLQILTPDGQPGWVSGRSSYALLNDDCDQIPEAEVTAPRTAGGTAANSGKGCYIFQNKLGTELNLTFTQSDTKWNVTFQIPAGGEQQQCFDPGPYTYTLDAPPPWGSTNGELTVSAGDNYNFPISGD